ncbi:GTP 3',8-cyclase MoaA [Azotosporobacter soli]|uniref:GTP 3',8-cyclase MoaA n=1 Tax=Azotosporobacter soli TaxID=3055040 RepID=UPI0031FF1E89
MQDMHQRTIDYLRVSLTDRCNFRCRYCMPKQGVVLRDHYEILRYEELLRLIVLFGQRGIRKVRLTGGEPLVRKGIVEFIRTLAGLGSLEDISLTTNGSLLAQSAAALKEAGLRRINISLDTVDPERFTEITGGCGRVEKVLEGLNEALRVGFQPVKINVVLSEAFQESDLHWFLELVRQKPVHVRFIEYMPIGPVALKGGLQIAEIKRLLAQLAKSPLLPLKNVVYGQGPARYYHLADSRGTFGFIAPLTEHFCGECNRLRLTADGKLKPCLLGEAEIDLAGPLRGGASDQELLQLFDRAVCQKPSGHALCAGSENPVQRKRGMSQIGG